MNTLHRKSRFGFFQFFFEKMLILDIDKTKFRAQMDILSVQILLKKRKFQSLKFSK